MSIEHLSEQGRANAFGVMRLLLAGRVNVSHAFPLGGWGFDPTGYLTHSQVNIGYLALLGFLVMSGYLVTTSARRIKGAHVSVAPVPAGLPRLLGGADLRRGHRRAARVARRGSRPRRLLDAH